MRKVYSILFLALAIYTCLSSVSFCDSALVSQQSIKHALHIQDQTAPFLHLRIPNEATYLKQLDFSMVSESQVRINGHQFNLVGLGIFSQFIDLRISLIETTHTSHGQTSDFNQDNSGMQSNAGAIIMNLPPAEVEVVIESFVLAQKSETVFYSENTLSGFKPDPGQPPRL